MSKIEKCLKSSHSANFGGGGNLLSPRNEDLENGTAKPCHPEERSDVGIASSLKNWLTNKRNGLIASSPYSPIDLKTKTAFTLAEVLITLGIIGIVAALTLPPLITQYKVKELEARFKKVDATLQTALKKSVVEFGYTDVTDLNISGRRVNAAWDGQGHNPLIGQFQNEVAELNKIWLKQFRGAQKIDYMTLFHKHIWCYDMLGRQLDSPAYSGCFFPGGDGSYILPDGTLISGLIATWGGINHPTVIEYLFDTNGPFKGPNRLGYDIFTYVSMPHYRTECNPIQGSSERLKECYEWASRNQSPINKTKPYWEILYKPESYWHK